MKIAVNQGKKDKIHIFCDGVYAFTVDAGYWFSSPYCSAEEIGDGESEVFLREVGSRCAFLAGLRLLAYSDQSKKELIDKLTRKKHTRENAVSAAERLEELGYINDARYAERLAENLFERGSASAQGVKYALIRKGIPREIAEDVSEALDSDPVLRVEGLLRGKFARGLTDEKGVKKTVAALRRLGYDWSDINSALRRVKSETEDFEDV